jgi:WD40 repeat protein
MTPKCPEHPTLSLESKKKGWYCEECDRCVLSHDQVRAAVSGAEGGPPPPATPPPAWPGGLDPAVLPPWLAHPWAALCAESHPRVRLHWLVDTAELVVRWTTAVALAEVTHAHAGALPASVTAAIAEHIERPTLGRWLLVLRSLCEAAPEKPAVTDGLFDFAAGALPARFRTEGQGGTVEDSLLVLRNHVAHGGGVGRARAAALVDAHLPTLIRLLAATRDALGPSVVEADGRVLQGPSNAGGALRSDAGAHLVRGGVALPLEPLVYHGPVCQVGPDGQLLVRTGGAAAQLYARGGPDRLTYTPLGREESHADRLDVTAFRALFRLDAPRAPSSAGQDGGFIWDDGLREARVVAEDLVGRQSELATAKAWLKSVDPHDSAGVRIGWISGGPGVGKSILMARLAADYENPKHRGLFVHRFRGGDARNSRRAFLRLLQAALCAWEPLHDALGGNANDPDTALEGRALEEDVRARLEALSGLAAPHPRAPRPSFWVFVDGLDEIAASDPGLPALLKQLALPGTVWLLAGRPDHGLDEAFADPSCVAVHPGGLPPMHAEDIRAMLVEGLGPMRYALFTRDADVDDGASNAFVDAVVGRARGLPLYVRLLIEDLRAGHLRVLDEDRLPDGLTAYYDSLVERLGVSTAKADLTAVVALLSQASEPIDAAGLAWLLAGRPERFARFQPRVEAALRVGAALLRRAPGADTADGWTLYHHSFREYVATSRGLADSVHDWRERLVESAGEWASLTDPALAPLRNHLFRRGTAYALAWDRQRGSAAARARLTDFSYLQARTAALPAHEATDLADEYRAVLAAPDADGDLKMWEAFVRERVHLLRRGNVRWPTNRILLQLAVEHADDSPVTQAAQRWLEGGVCDWLWLRRANRPARARIGACLKVFEGHRSQVWGARALPDGRILSWSLDGSVRVWDPSSGAALASMDEHEKSVEGATLLPDGRFLSWSFDGTLRLWDGSSGAPLVTLAGHTEAVVGARVLADGRILSWARDSTLRLWDGSTGAPVATFEGHSFWVAATEILCDGRILSWAGGDLACGDHVLRIWDPASGGATVQLTGHEGSVIGARCLRDGRILSWSSDCTIRLWDGSTGALLATRDWHQGMVAGAIVLSDGRIVSSCYDGHVRLWDGESGALLSELTTHPGGAMGAAVLPDGRILSWCDDLEGDSQPRLSDGRSGALLTTLEGHTGDVEGASAISDGRILSWSSDGTLRVWDGASGAPVGVLEGHTSSVDGAMELSDGRILSWSSDGTLRLWDVSGEGFTSRPDRPRSRIRHTTLIESDRALSWSEDGPRLWDLADGSVVATLEPCADALAIPAEYTEDGETRLQDGRILTWTEGDRALRLWDGTTGAPIAVLEGHTQEVSGALVTPEGRVLSWSKDGTMRLWDGRSGAPLAVMEGHTGALELSALALSDGRILSWSYEPDADHQRRHVWDAASGALLTTLREEVSFTHALGLPDGRILTWRTLPLLDGCLHLWDGATGALLATLEGHRFAVSGALKIRGGRILSWSLDRTLRIWDDATGAPLATMEVAGTVLGAAVLPFGRILTWGDSGLEVWDGTTGASLGSVRAKAAFRSAPGLYRAWSEACAPSTVQFEGLVNGRDGGVQLALGRRRFNPVVPWHADGQWNADHLLPDGTIVGRCDKELAVLHLFHGRRRVNLDEAQSIASLPPEVYSAPTSRSPA